jgi:hypothetical protein
MSRRNQPHISGTKLRFGAVVHPAHHPSRDDVKEMANLAAIGDQIEIESFSPWNSRWPQLEGSIRTDQNTPRVMHLLLQLGKLGSHLKVQDSAESLKTSVRQIADWLALSLGRQGEFTFRPGETDYQGSKNMG